MLGWALFFVLAALLVVFGLYVYLSAFALGGEPAAAPCATQLFPAPVTLVAGPPIEACAGDRLVSLSPHAPLPDAEIEQPCVPFWDELPARLRAWLPLPAAVHPRAIDVGNGLWLAVGATRPPGGARHAAFLLLRAKGSARKGSGKASASGSRKRGGERGAPLGPCQAVAIGRAFALREASGGVGGLAADKHQVYLAAGRQLLAFSWVAVQQMFGPLGGLHLGAADAVCDYLAARAPLHILTYVINLDKYPERYDITCQRLREQGHPAARIHRVSGLYRDSDPAAYAAACAEYRFRPCAALKPAQVGCAASHLKTLEIFLASGEEAAMVVEDDLLLPAGWPGMLAAALACAPADADALFLGWQKWGWWRARNAPVYPAYPFCLHCYVVTRAGARRFVDAVRRAALNCPIDNWVVSYAAKAGLRFYAVNPAYFLPRPLAELGVTTQHPVRADGIAFQDMSIDSTIDPKLPLR